MHLFKIDGVVLLVALTLSSQLTLATPIPIKHSTEHQDATDSVGTSQAVRVLLEPRLIGSSKKWTAKQMVKTTASKLAANFKKAQKKHKKKTEKKKEEKEKADEAASSEPSRPTLRVDTVRPTMPEIPFTFPPGPDPRLILTAAVRGHKKHRPYLKLTHHDPNQMVRRSASRRIESLSPNSSKYSLEQQQASDISTSPAIGSLSASLEPRLIGSSKKWRAKKVVRPTVAKLVTNFKKVQKKKKVREKDEKKEADKPASSGSPGPSEPSEPTGPILRVEGAVKTTMPEIPFSMPGDNVRYGLARIGVRKKHRPYLGAAWPFRRQEESIQKRLSKKWRAKKLVQGALKRVVSKVKEERKEEKRKKEEKKNHDETAGPSHPTLRQDVVRPPVMPEIPFSIELEGPFRHGKARNGIRQRNRPYYGAHWPQRRVEGEALGNEIEGDFNSASA